MPTYPLLQASVDRASPRKLEKHEPSGTVIEKDQDDDSQQKDTSDECATAQAFAQQAHSAQTNNQGATAPERALAPSSSDTKQGADNIS